ncbi:Stealth-like protein [Ilumatobacter fluminis]|uniref:Stealth-like protein n=1 Tax=Ilumatobacter fluminis TaxID=467091 RepID=A0A4R7I2D6_9ACTN|nr:Stealth-like protein [Ilumatobacter fluminis]
MLDTSIRELAFATALDVVGVFQSAGLEPFVVDLSEGRVVLGLLADDRPAALRALAANAPGLLVEWTDRGRTGLDAAMRATRRVAVARRWCIFRPLAVGERSTGPESGVVVTFWALGPSGHHELVGTRGHERFDERSARTTEELDGCEFPGLVAFPVASDLRRLHEPVDLVYTWVDGADPEWRAAFRRTARECGRERSDPALDPARYRSRDELKYSLRSVWMNCGWVRQVYVVTAGQRPDWLADHEKVTVVDHRAIMPETALPTFNSHAIEASLHHIPGLSEHFVYLNDDMFVTRPTTAETFFHPNGLARVFMSGARVPGHEDEGMQAVDTAARRGRELLRARFGRVVADKQLHSPYPLRRSAMAEMDEEFSEAIERTRHSRFRSSTDVSTASSFAQHYAIATQRATFDEIASEYVHVESKRLGWHLDRIRLGDDIVTCCVNETADDGADSVERERRLAEFFEAMFPVPAPWER